MEGWLDKYKEGGKKSKSLPEIEVKSISPRQQAYNDSLLLYNASNFINNLRKISESTLGLSETSANYIIDEGNRKFGSDLADYKKRKINYSPIKSESVRVWEGGNHIGEQSFNIFKKPLYNPSEHTISPIQSKEATLPSQQQIKSPSKTKNGFTTDLPNYPGWKVEHTKEGKPMRVVGPKGQSFPYDKNASNQFSSYVNGGEITKADDGIIVIKDEKGKERKISLDEYRKLYESGKLATTYDERTFSVPTLPEVEIKGKKSAGRRWLDNYTEAIARETDGPGSMLLAPLNAIFSAPQMAATSLFTGTPERPSEAMEIESPIGGMITDAILDPLNLIGAEFVKNPFKSQGWKKKMDLAKDVFDRSFYKKSYKKLNDVVENNKKIGREIDNAIHANYNIENRTETIVGKKYNDVSDRLWDINERGAERDYGRKTVKEQFKKEGEDIVDETSPALSKATNTGVKPVTHFRTNSQVEAKVSLPETKTIHKLVDDGTGKKKLVIEQFSNSKVEVSPEYKEATIDNIKYIEETIPGAKVFGSARGVAEGDLPHLTGDYDVLISKKNYDKHVKDKLKFVEDKGPAKEHSLGDQFGDQGNIDFNIIDETKAGKATGKRAEELFKQTHPDEYFEAARKAAKSKKPIEIPYTPDELLEATDPTIKTITDAYESVKEKHINKIDSYISYGNPDRVTAAQERYIKLLVGEKGTIGHQFSLDELSNVEKNKEILYQIDFIGDHEAVANNPKRMQTAINDFYINNTTLSRGSDAGLASEVDLDLAASAFKEWKPELGGGQMMGSGMNHVLLGDSEYFGFYANKQLGIDHDITDPLAYVDGIKRQIHGDYPYSPSEKQAINEILRNNGIERQVETPADLIQFTSYHQNAKQILSDVADITGRKAVAYSSYGNSKYASTYKDWDDQIGALQFALREHVTVPKSYMERQKGLNSKNRMNITMTKEKFKKIYNLLDGGLNRAEARKENLRKQLEEIRTTIDRETQKLTKKNPEYQKNLEKEQKLRQEYEELADLQEQIKARLYKVEKLRERAKAVGILGGATTVVGGLTAAVLNAPDPSERYMKAWQKRQQEESKKPNSVLNTDKYQKGGKIKQDNLGYYNPENWGKPVKINSNRITMKGLSTPLLGISDSGDTRFMMPNEEHKFKGNSVTEYPIAERGKWVPQYGETEYKQLTSFTNPPSKKKGGWIEKYQDGGLATPSSFIEYARNYNQEEDEKVNPQNYFGLKDPNYIPQSGAIDYDLTPEEIALFIATSGASSIIKKGAQSIAKKAISKIRFTPQEGMLYRGLGKAGYEDAIQSGVFRPKQTVEPLEVISKTGRKTNISKQFDKTYYAPAHKFDVVKRYGKDYIAEVPENSATFYNRYGGGKDWSKLTKEQIPIEKGRILKKDWLRGYKEVKKPKRK